MADLRTRGSDKLAEGRRRAEIVARYVAIERPSGEDDRRFAEELGLSRSSLVRLATIWHRHRDEKLLAGAVAAVRARGAPHERVHARRIALHGLPAGRRSETLRLIRAIQAHLVAVERGEGDLHAAAAEVGLSPGRFRVLVKAWQVHADPAEMPGAYRRRAPRRRDGDRARTLDILEQAVLDEGPGARVTSIDRRYRLACDAAGVRALSVPRVYALVQEIRGRTGGAVSRAAASNSQAAPRVRARRSRPPP